MSNHVPHPDHDRGLEFDLSTMISRRSLGMFFGAGGAAAALAACTPGGPGTTTATPSAAPTLTRAIAECGVEIPQETAGPFPGDGSNGPNVLAASGVVRQDITASFGTGSASQA